MKQQRPSDEQLDAYLLGIASTDERAVVDGLAATSPTFATAIAARQQEHEALDVDRGLAKMRVATRPPRAWSMPRFIMPLVAVAACCIAVLLVSTPATDPTTSGVRLRGDVNVRIVAQRGGEAFGVEEDTVLRVGDQLRFLVLAPGYAHVAIIGFDERGTVALYPDGTSSTTIGPDGALPFAIELDETSGDERFAIVVADRPFAPADAMESLRVDDHLGGRPGHAVAWRTIKKERR